MNNGHDKDKDEHKKEMTNEEPSERSCSHEILNDNLINIANEFKGLISKMENDLIEVRKEVKSLKGEIKELKETDVLKKEFSQPKRKPVGFFELELCQATKRDIVFFVFAVLGSLVAGCAMPLISLLLGDVIDGFDGTIPPEKVPTLISGVITNFCLAGVGIFAGSLLMVVFWTIIGHRLSNQIKIDYFRVIMRQEQAWFDEVNTFEFTTKLQTQTQVIENGIGTKVGVALCAISQFVVSFLIGYITSWKLSLVITAMLPLLGIGGWFMANAMKQGTAEMRTYEKAGGMAEEVLYQIKTVASFANFGYEKERYQAFLNQSRQAGIKQGFKSGFGIGFIIFVIYASYALAIGYGSKLISDPKEINDNTKRAFGAGDVITVLFAIIFGCFSLGQAAPNIKAIVDACNAAQEYFELKERKPKVSVSQGVEKPDKDTLIGHLKFNEVLFKYSSNDRVILRDISMDFTPGQKIAIVGPSGIGKSTIFSLIERFYEPLGGTITFDGKNIKDIDINYWRSLIGYVPQEPVLFNTTIRENIIFGRENITDDDIMTAVQKAYATEIIDKCSLDYIVGVKGEKLSGGQRQRIAIARAVLLKPKLLILDEATSALDNKSEKEVQKALDQVSEGIASIIIAHKIDTIKNSHKIFCFDKNGVIAEEGTHEDLVKKNGVYADLYRKREKKEHDLRLSLGLEESDDDIEDVSNNNINPNLNEVSQLNKSSCFQNNPNSINLDGDESNLNNDIMKKLTNPPRAQTTKPTVKKSSNEFEAQTTELAVKKSSNELEAKQSLRFKDSIIPDEVVLGEKEKSKLKNKIEKEFLKKGRKHVFDILKCHKCFMAGGAIFASLNGAVWPTYGVLLAMGISVLSDKDPEKVSEGGLVIAMAFLGLAIGAGIALWFQNYFFYGIGEILTSFYRKEVYDKLLNLHMGYFDQKENSPGAVLTKLSSETTKITGVATSVFGQFLQTGITLILGIVIAFVFQWAICLINIAFMPLVIGSYIFQFTLQQGASEGNKNVDEEAGNVLSESVINTKTIFSYNMQKKIVDMYADIIYEAKTEKKKTKGYCHLAVNGIFYSLTQFVIFAMYATLFYVGGNLYKDGKASFQEIVTAIFTILFSALGVGIAQMFVGDYAGGKRAIICLQKILETQSEINVQDSIANGVTKEDFQGKIEFRNVRFRYKGNKAPIFRNLSFVIEPGQNVAFVGASGSGKSTIISLIERFYDVSSGSVLIDDVDIKEYNIEQLRKKIGIVLQQPALFNRSIKDNIQYGRLGANEEDIEKAAKEANIFTKMKDDESNEANVSGGEKQRIAIARAILKNPSILLLDEATSALDKENEELIKESLSKLMKNRTSLIVAHRLSTIINCDKIFVLLNGEIVETGTHQELMNMNKKYAELYKGSSA